MDCNVLFTRETRPNAVGDRKSIFPCSNVRKAYVTARYRTVLLRRGYRAAAPGVEQTATRYCDLNSANTRLTCRAGGCRRGGCAPSYARQRAFAAAWRRRPAAEEAATSPRIEVATAAEVTVHGGVTNCWPAQDRPNTCVVDALVFGGYVDEKCVEAMRPNRRVLAERSSRVTGHEAEGRTPANSKPARLRKCAARLPASSMPADDIAPDEPAYTTSLQAVEHRVQRRAPAGWPA